MTIPWLVVSPHCDDAVFGCGALLAAHPGSVAVTVFAGTPHAYEPFTEWDRACGFAPGDDVMALRREEDARALALLAAQPVWLPLLDSQYRNTSSVAAVADALLGVIEAHGPRAIAFPLGLFHSDHVLVREAMLTLARRALLPPLVMYADALYRRIPEALDHEVADIARRGYDMHGLTVPCSAQAQALKRAAVECYRSQLRALATPGRLGHLDAYEPERYLALTQATATV